MNASGMMGLVEPGDTPMVPYVANRWYEVSLLFNWTNKTVDYYVDGSLAVPAVPFRATSVNSLSIIHLYNFNATQAWWDEIEFLGGNSLTPSITISPTNSGNFINGVWTGNITVLQAATNVVLSANDGLGHSGSSNPFQVVSNPVAVLTVNTNGSGTVNPNYNGARLQIGQPYSMTATPGTGYVFFRWTGSLTTNNSVLNFVMASNLAFTANFANQTNPVVGINPGSSNQLVISWPAGVTNFIMQTNGNLGTTNWGNYNGAVITTNGTAEQIVIIPTNQNLFFRLKQ